MSNNVSKNQISSPDESHTSPIVKVHYKKGDVIFFEGDLDGHFFIIETGTVQIYTKSGKGKRVNICTISDGESFGEFAFLDRKPRSATAEAMTDLTLVRVSEEGFKSLLEELPGWAVAMLKSFTIRIKAMTELIKDFEETLLKKANSVKDESKLKSISIEKNTSPPQLKAAEVLGKISVPPYPKPMRAKPQIADEQTSDFFLDLEETNSKIKHKQTR